MARIEDISYIYLVDLAQCFSNSLLFFSTVADGGVGWYGWVEGRMREGCLVDIENRATSIFQHPCCSYGFVVITTIRMHSNKIVKCKT